MDETGIIDRYSYGDDASDQAAAQQQQQPEQEQQQQGSPGQDSMATGSAAVRSTVSAEQALLKITSSTVQKLPKLQGRQVTVKTAMTYIKKFATAKKFAWVRCSPHYFLKPMCVPCVLFNPAESWVI